MIIAWLSGKRLLFRRAVFSSFECFRECLILMVVWKAVLLLSALENDWLTRRFFGE
ncbi:MAG: hypothetical protein F6K22_32810 [Okeania sp. SIO2F4]|nr:hypothetical protein [Okeania sp. SIO2F4]